MLKTKIITIGGCTEDIALYTEGGILIDNKEDLLRQNLLAFEFGTKIKVNKSYSSFGGGAANVAACLSSLGLDASIISALGDDDRGARVIKNLKTFGVNTKLIQRVSGGSSFSFLLIGPENEHILFSDRASNNLLKIREKELKAIRSADWVYVSSLSGHWQDVLNKVFSTNKAKIAWNPGGTQLKAGHKLLKKYLERTYVLSLNKDEALELVLSDEKYRSKDNKFLNNTKNLLHIIKEWGPQIVLITNGSEGAEAYDGIKFYSENIIKARKVSDTTGVGDAFGATFVAGLNKYDEDIQRSLKLGMYNAASVIEHQGAQNGLLTKKKIPEIL
ncbi:MAG: carbohydrate kinase family protein [Patescibacteria group bacterium]|jgi:fructokinase|nr:carbohydrate kinase family protein [Patescibacteria group bacterium]